MMSSVSSLEESRSTSRLLSPSLMLRSRLDVGSAEQSVAPLIEEEKDASELAAIRAEKLRWDSQLKDLSLSKKKENGPEWTKIVESYYQAHKRLLLKTYRDAKSGTRIKSKAGPPTWDMVSLHRSMKLLPSGEVPTGNHEVPPEQRFISIQQLMAVFRCDASWCSI